MKWDFRECTSVKGCEALFGMYNMKSEDYGNGEVDAEGYVNGVERLEDSVFDGEEEHIDNFISYLRKLNDTFEVSDYPSFIRLKDKLDDVVDYLNDRLIVGSLDNLEDKINELVYWFGDYVLVNLECEDGVVDGFLLHYTVFCDLLGMDCEGIYMGCTKQTDTHLFRLGEGFCVMSPIEF